MIARPTGSTSRRSALLIAAFVVVTVATGCPPPEPPPLTGVQVATITGEVFVEDPDRRSVGGAVVSVLGTPATDVSEAGKQFVLDSVALGKRTVSIVDATLGRSAQLDVELTSPFQTLTLADADTTLLRSASVTGVVSGFDDDARPQVFLVGGTSQVALVGGDGSFRLDDVPARAVTIGVAALGKGLVLLDVTLGEGEVKALDPITLAPASGGNLKLAGSVQLAGETDHTGTTVILNGGEQVVGSAADGSYEFVGLAPGRFEVRAQRPGFRSVVMQTVALADDGSVSGLFDAFLAPGDDNDDVVAPVVGEGEGEEGEGEPPPPPRVDIVFPAPNDAFPGGAPIVLAAEVDNADGATLTWSLADALGDDAVAFDVGGATIVADLPVVDVDTFFTVVAALPDGTADAVIIRVQPPIVAEVQAQATTLGVGLPDSEPLIEGGVLVGARLTLQQGHPADVKPAAGLSAVWTEVGGGAFQNAIPLATLPVGTHRFDGVITTGDGQQGAIVVEVVVQPLVFSVGIAEPNDATDYFADTGLPLRAVATHGWQTSFLTTSVAWRLPTGQVVGAGLTGVANGVVAGADVVTVEVVDLAGNRAFATVPFQLDAVQFSAFFNSPPAESTFQTATPVRINVGFDHNRLSDADRAAAFVNVRSDRVGLLRMDDGTQNLTPGSDFFVSSLPEGRHVLTAQVFAGGRVAQTTTTITLQSKFVSSTLVAPARDLVAILGEPVAMSVAVSGGNGAVPQVRWFMDGAEFPADWPGYGADPAAVARRSLSLGNFDPAAFPFNDTNAAGGLIWQDGRHLIEVSVAADDVDPGLGCVNLGTRAQCRSFNVEVARAVRVINTNLSVNTGQTEILEGVVRLQAQITVNGGTLLVLPGARVLLDMRDVANPASQTGNSSNRRIVFTSGVVRIGESGGVTPVTFETLKSFPTTNRWGGIADNGAVNNDRTFSAQNVVLRDATRAYDLEGIDINSNGRSAVFEDLVIEDVDDGIFVECPTALDRVTIRRTLQNRLALRFNLQTACPANLRYSDITISNTTSAMQLNTAAQPTAVTLSGLDLSATSTGLDVQANVSLRLEDSRFTGLTSTFAGNAMLQLNAADDVVVRRSRFENGTFAIAALAVGLGSLDVRDCTFDRLTRGLSVRQSARDTSYEVHGNVFTNVSSIGVYEGGSRDLVELQGNFVGAFTDATSAARAVKTTPAGTVPIVIAQITDHIDNPTSGANFGRMRIDNPLPTTTVPLAVIREPNESEPWNARQCVPFVAAAVDDDFDAANDCAFSVSSPGGASLTAVTLDADGCWDDARDGTFDVHLVCDGTDAANNPITTEHVSRLLVDSTRFSGPIHPRGDVWRGTVVVDGDVVVPEGAVLDVAADAVVRFAAADRTLHLRPIGTNGNFNDPRLRGAVNRIDFFVDGAVNAIDDGGVPIRFIADAGRQKNTWSGFLLSSGAAIDLDGVDVESTVSVFTADAGENASLVPTFQLTGLTVRESNTVASGICPVLVSDLVTETTNEIYTCRMTAPSEVDGAVLNDVAQPNSGWFFVDDATASVTPGLTLRDVSGNGNPQNRRTMVVAQVGTGRIELVGVDVVDAFAAVESQAVNQVIDVSGLSLDTFTTAFIMGDDDTLIVNDAVFRAGTSLIDGNLGRTTVTDSHTIGVTTPFRDTNISTTVAMTVNGNVFEDAAVVFDFAQGFASAGAAAFDLGGNNFLRATTRVLRLTGGQANSLVGRWSLDGSHFGVAGRAAVLPLIEDPRTDSPADANDNNVGRTSFANFSDSPLALDVR